MGFADDLILMADDHEDMRLMLREVHDFMGKRGMTVNPSKSVSLVVRAGGADGQTVQGSVLEIGGKKIPAVSALTPFKYLGHMFGPTGVNKPTVPNLQTWLQRISGSALKPDQEMVLLRDYMIPKLLYGLQNTKVTGGMLKDVDRLVRNFVKKTLHLSVHTPNCLFYGKVRDGGLGVMELRSAVPHQLLSRLTKLLQTTQDPVVEAALQSNGFRTVFRALTRLAGDTAPDQVHKEAIKVGPYSKGLEATSEDPASRSWQTIRPSGWTGRDYVRAIHLRTNNLPCRGLPYIPAEQRRCRFTGCHAQESIPHILQKCEGVHGERIRRHNEVVTKVANHCRGKGWSVEEEPHVRHADGQLFKPDLIVHLEGNKSVVCDVQVSWDGPGSLDVAYARKKAVYGNDKFLEAARLRWSNKSFVFAPLIIGARGIWPRINEPTEGVLGLTKQLKASCVHSALKWGSSMHNTFMRRVWANGTRPGVRPV